MTRPSAGDKIAFGCDGTTRGGSRKNCTMNTAMSHTGTAANHQPANDSAMATVADIATNNQTSRAMKGCGYPLFIVTDRISKLLRRLVHALVQILRLLLDRALQSASALHGGGGSRCYAARVQRRGAYLTRAPWPALSGRFGF